MVSASKLPFEFPERLTRAGEELARRLHRAGRPVIAPYELFGEVRRVYASGKRLYLRGDSPGADDYNRLRINLIDAGVIAPDQNYGHRLYRVLSAADGKADEVCCLADPFCYVSHLSAMQHYGISERKSATLHITRPNNKMLRPLIAQRVEAIEEGEGLPYSPRSPSLQAIRHPGTVRRRTVHLHQSSQAEVWVQASDSHVRVLEIGRAFANSLGEPSLCGGMAHVVDMFRQHARAYIEEIVSAVDAHMQPIVKVRAGYLFDEVVNVFDARIDAWRKYAQRGGSRVLDPEKPFAPTFSEKWMISKNL